MTNPLLGVFLLTLGGLLGGSFYVPFSKVKHWSWETYWLTMGIPAWVVMPWLVAWLTVPNLLEILCNSPLRSLALAYIFGAMWGVGAVMFGLTMRYLGISLGMSMVIGLCAAFATLIPPFVDGQYGELLASTSGLMLLLGVAVCLAGIAVCGYAGVRKERELTDQQKQEGVKEFALVKGFVVATISGIMNAGLVYGINAGRPIAQVALELGAPEVYQNNPTFIVVMFGGFTVNSIWCLMLNVSNRSIREYVSGSCGLLLSNYFWIILAGTIWYIQVLLYGMGTTKMGQYAFSAWPLMTALVIVVSNCWGLMLKEWKGVSLRTLMVLLGGLFVLILSAIIITAGNQM